MKVAVGILGLLALSLGALWVLQGTGLIHIRPILCVAQCEEIQGPSLVWAVAGLVLAAIGAWAARFGFRRSRL